MPRHRLRWTCGTRVTRSSARHTEIASARPSPGTITQSAEYVLGIPVNKLTLLVVPRAIASSASLRSAVPSPPSSRQHWQSPPVADTLSGLTWVRCFQRICHFLSVDGFLIPSTVSSRSSSSSSCGLTPRKDHQRTLHPEFFGVRGMAVFLFFQTALAVSSSGRDKSLGLTSWILEAR